MCTQEKHAATKSTFISWLARLGLARSMKRREVNANEHKRDRREQNTFFHLLSVYSLIGAARPIRIQNEVHRCHVMPGVGSNFRLLSRAQSWSHGCGFRAAEIRTSRCIPMSLTNFSSRSSLLALWSMVAHLETWHAKSQLGIWSTSCVSPGHE